MSSILETAVETINSVAKTSFSIFSSFITFNYYVGDIIFVTLQHIYTTCISILTSLFVAIGIMLEDLVVFLQEIFEATSIILSALETCLSLTADGIYNMFATLGTSIISVINGFSSWLTAVFNFIICGVTNIGFFLDLVGRSIFLLCNLAPRTLYVIYVSTGLVLQSCKENAIAGWTRICEILSRTSPEVVLGLGVGLTSTLLLSRLAIRTVRSREVTLESAARALLGLVCRAYVYFIRLVARVIGLVFTVTEMTISHLRVPMFAHAGDSDDEEEDREHLVGEVEPEEEEERERQERKRRNYQLMVERAQGLGGEGMEDQLLREMEREREDKLCVICQDREKCIMILPCRHLCICETCQGPLRTHRNTCPICRRAVKQMIKAYL